MYLFFDLIIMMTGQLPDYHDIVENPMDFQTVRKKLDEGVYSCLEHFEVRT